MRGGAIEVNDDGRLGVEDPIDILLTLFGGHFTIPALHPFPAPVRTLDALQLASMDFLRRHGQEVELAAYDKRLLAVAKLLRFKIHPAFR